MQQAIAEKDKPIAMQEALDKAARACYIACEDCKAYETDERRVAECSGCGIEKARVDIVYTQQKMMNGGGRCA